MAVTFPDKIHPKYKLRLRFDYEFRPIQYLVYFDIIIDYPIYKFIPLDITFKSSDELYQFLYNRGIVYEEVDVFHYRSDPPNEYTIVDTSKIYDLEENISKYLINYKYYSINEVAEMLSFSRPTIYKLINNNILNSFRINGQIRIKHKDLFDFINKENKKAD